MGDFGVGKMFGQITQGEEKIATDTSLVVDDILKNIGIYGPAVILALSFLYTPELSKAAAVNCYHEHAQGFTERLYMNNYCWESLQDYNHATSKSDFDFEARLSSPDGLQRLTFTEDAVAGNNFSYHRGFVLALLLAIFICILPSSIWAVIDFDKKIKLQGDYLEVGVEEALQLVLRQMNSLVKSELATTDVVEAAQDKNVKTRLQAHIKKMKQQPDGDGRGLASEQKFNCFQTLIQAKLGETKLVMQYVNKRFLTVFLIIVTSAWLWWCYVDEGTSFFDCRIPMSPLTADGKLRTNGVEFIVRCGLEGVAVRIFLVKMLMLGNVIAVAAAGKQWLAERSECEETRKDFSIMTEGAVPGRVTRSLRTSVVRHSDFDLLLFLTMRNLNREENKLYQTCAFALRSAKATTNDSEEVSKLFFEHLYGIIARAESSDAEVEAGINRIGSD